MKKRPAQQTEREKSVWLRSKRVNSSKTEWEI